MSTNILYIVSLFATFIYAISGILTGMRKKLDLFGLAFLGFITSLGGGTIRDMLIGNYPLTWVSDKNFPIAVLLALPVTIILKKRLMHVKRVLFYLDILGVALFSIIGLQKSLDFGASPASALIFGVMSAIMGGVLRDVFCNEVPMVLRKEMYATPSFLGGIGYLLLLYAGLDKSLAFAGGAGIIITLRLLVMKYSISLPKVQIEQGV